MTGTASRRSELWQRALQIAVVCGLVVLIVIEVSGFASPELAEVDDIGEQDADRNERSTPRSFILPATPGVAFKQEQERQEARLVSEMARCMPQLTKLGIEFEGMPVSSNISFKEAVARFQRENGLPSTGKVDEFTEAALQCQK